MFRPIACIFSNSAVKLQACFNKVELSWVEVTLHWEQLALRQVTIRGQKQYTWLLIITSANVDQFTNFLHFQIPEEISYTRHKDSLSHLKHVSMLPCKTWKLQLLPIPMSYCMWNPKFIMRDMRPPNNSGLNPVTIKPGKQCSSA